MDDDTKTPASYNTDDPLVLYTRSLHDHTLSQWAETRRVAEEKARERQLKTGEQQKVAISMPNLRQGEGEDERKKSDSSSLSQPDQSSDDQR
jgi:hypothetical protein